MRQDSAGGNRRRRGGSRRAFNPHERSPEEDNSQRQYKAHKETRQDKQRPHTTHERKHHATMKRCASGSAKGTRITCCARRAELDNAAAASSGFAGRKDPIPIPLALPPPPPLGIWLGLPTLIYSATAAVRTRRKTLKNGLYPSPGQLKAVHRHCRLSSHRIVKFDEAKALRAAQLEVVAHVAPNDRTEGRKQRHNIWLFQTIRERADVNAILHFGGLLLSGDTSRKAGLREDLLGEHLRSHRGKVRVRLLQGSRGGRRYHQRWHTCYGSDSGAGNIEIRRGSGQLRWFFVHIPARPSRALSQLRGNWLSFV